MGIASSVLSLANIIPPLGAGVMVALFGLDAAILFGALIVLCGWALFLRSYRPTTAG
jgi:hypothetical protein